MPAKAKAKASAKKATKQEQVTKEIEVKEPEKPEVVKDVEEGTAEPSPKKKSNAKGKH